MEYLKKPSIHSHAKKMMTLIKSVKPILKLLTKKQRTNAVTPSTCNYDVVESMQNNINESEIFRLHFKFPDDSEETQENLKNEELERRLTQASDDGEEEKHSGTYFAVPVILRSPVSDVDIHRHTDEYVTYRQIARSQTPVPIV